jgi:16S rRNA processing protein RimM
MDKEKCFNLGKIIRVHGIHGEVVVFSNTLPHQLNLSSKNIFLENFDSSLYPYVIANCRKIKNNQLLIKIEGINTIDEAQKIKGYALWIPFEYLPELTAHEFYSQEIIGFKLIDVQSGEVGYVNDVFDIPSNRLIQVIKNNKEILIPAAKQFITEINRVEKTLIMDLPQGLLEVYLNDE